MATLTRSVLRVAMAILVVGVATASPAAGRSQDGRVFHVPPVSVPVSDEFRPPEHPFGPGNRGLEYATEPGMAIRASADGEVVFAGRVAWHLHVTVEHLDGVRTSYSFLSEVGVVVGQAVRQGETIGLAGEQPFHFGARRGGRYFDPASLFGAVDVRVELLPLEVPPGSAPDDERAALWRLAQGEHRGRLPGAEAGGGRAAALTRRALGPGAGLGAGPAVASPGPRISPPGRPRILTDGTWRLAPGSR